MIVAGAGMAGLVTAVRARELGLAPVVYEKGTRPGGSMLLSSGVVWRHAEWEAFRRECPAGDERLQRLVWERLDDALDWLRSLGAPVLRDDTENPLTTGMRFDTRGLTERPLLNHLAVLVDSAADAVADADGLGIEVESTVDAANTVAAFLAGPEGVRIEYVEHKASFSLR